MAHGIELSVDWATTFKLLHDTGSDPLWTLAIGGNLKPIRRMLWWYQYVDEATKSVGGNYIYTSVDGGVSVYNPLSGSRLGGVQCMAVDPNDAYTAYIGESAVGSPILEKSIDGGLTFTDLSAGILALPLCPDTPGFSSILKIAVDPTNSLNVYVCFRWLNDNYPGLTMGLAKSADGGVTWAWADGPYSTHYTSWVCTELAVNPRNGEVIQVGASGSPWPWEAKQFAKISDDGGATWNNYGPIFSQDYHSIAISKTSKLMVVAFSLIERTNGILVSFDDGRTWVDKHSADFISDAQLGTNFVAIDLSGTTMYLTQRQWVGNYAGALYRSGNFSTSWTNVYQNPPPLNYDFSIKPVPDPVNVNWIWFAGIKGAGSSAGIWLSRNGGLTWKAKRFGVNLGIVPELFEVGIDQKVVVL